MKLGIRGALVCAIAAATAQAASAQGLPVIPGAAGFGITTPAGRGGQIYRVTNLNDSGPGSLRECAEASGPRVCVFETSGAIELTPDKVINVRSGNLTIAGQTAPSPGIEIRNAGLYIHASDVLVQHIAIRPGDRPGPNPGNRDALMIEGDDQITSNVVIDHVSLTWSVDELATNYYGWDNVTFQHVIFAEPLNDSINPQGIHAFGVLMYDNSGRGRVSFIGNLFANMLDRAPRSRTTKLVLVNNLAYNNTQLHTTLSTLNGVAGDASIVGNVYIDGPMSRRWRKTIWFEMLGSGSRIHINDNVGPEGTDWSLVSNDSGVGNASLRADSRPIWPSGLSAKPRGQVRDWVLENVGSRPADRAAPDRSIVDNVRNGTGRIVDCISGCSNSVGGWPTLARRTRALDLPANPSGDSDGDGYTNLEEWLHARAAEVEGKAPIVTDVPPAAPANLRVDAASGW